MFIHIRNAVEQKPRGSEQVGLGSFFVDSTGSARSNRTVTLVSRERGKDNMADRSGQTKKLDDCKHVEQAACAPNDDQQYGC